MDIAKQYDAGITAKEYAIESVVGENNDLGRVFLRKQISAFEHNSNLLDIGCGSGLDLKAYQDMGFKHLSGVDPSENFICEAREILNNEVRLANGTFEQLPFDDEMFDIVVSRFALHYSKDIPSSIKEVSRVLKAGGAFMVVMSHPTLDAIEPIDANGHITTTLFGGKVSITFPRHTLAEIFSDEFLKLFELQTFYEYNGMERDGNAGGLPSALCFIAIKK